MKGLIGRKLGMTQVFAEDGVVSPVTIVEAGPCFVTQIKSDNKDYKAVQLGFEEVKPRKLTGGQRGHLQRNRLPALRHLFEFRYRGDLSVEEGQKLTAAIFSVGDRVDVIGKSKGKGFQGAMKRHGFGGGPKTHGQSDRARAPGSIGAGSTPGRVLKGMRMPGRMGNDKVTSQNLKVVFVDTDRNLIGVRGSVPGPKGGLVTLHGARKS